MKRIVAIINIIAFFMAVSLSIAGKPPGLMKKGKTPYGFSHGKKKGWHDEYPPGWEHKKQKPELKLPLNKNKALKPQKTKNKKEASEKNNKSKEKGKLKDKKDKDKKSSCDEEKKGKEQPE